MTTSQRIAKIVADYREGEIETPSEEHVEEWLAQFPRGIREELAAEIEHVLGHTYFSKERVKKFLSKLIVNPKITEGDPAGFWSGTSCLQIQSGGKKSTTLGFEDMLNLSDAAKKLINAQIPEHLDTSFQFDWKEFSEHLAYRSIELSNGAILTAEAPDFDTVFKRSRAPDGDGSVRFSTEGRITGERLGKSKIERLGR